jgi:O-antigen ligase
VLTFLLRKGKLGRILAAIAIPSSVWFILKTASRANFLTLFAVVAIGFVIAAPSIRILLLVTVPIGLAITLPLLPQSTLDRITAVEVSTSIAEVGQEGSQATDAQRRGALDSEAARMNLAKLAFTATLRNPVFGSGMGMFADETADYIQRTTRTKAPWQTAHNSYLKVSSENGIPAFLFYVWSILAAIFVTWRSVKQSRRRPGFEDANRNSICILLALVVYAFGTFFCDIVYLPYLAITIGLAAANYLAFRNEDLLTAMASQGPLRR